VLAATNKDLEQKFCMAVFARTFFYRLNVIPFFRFRRSAIAPRTSPSWLAISSMNSAPLTEKKLANSAKAL